jgi:hypothetical protein
LPRPPHVPDAKSRRYVKSAAALGATQAGLSHILDCSIGTLKKNYASELAHGAEELVLAIGSRLVKQAMSKIDSQPNTTARLFLLKTRGKWRETGPEHSDTGEQRPIVTINLPDNGRGLQTIPTRRQPVFRRAKLTP